VYPTTNYGMSTRLLVDTTPEYMESYVRFAVSGVTAAA